MASRLGINVTGRVFSVTGGASGMGLATATFLARHGAAAVWIADPQTARFDHARKEITAANSSTDVHLEAVDVSDSKQPMSLKIPNGPNLLGETDDVWRRIMSVNLDGVMYCTRAQVRAMLGMEKGSNPAIVNVSSMGAITHGGALYAYATSKAGCEHFTRNVAKDVFPYGIRINGVLPGNTTTPMSDQFFEGLPQEMRDQAMAKIGLSSNIQPEDIARAVVWLLSENSLTVNGVSLPVGEGAP
ncbi:oxidoreductase [Fusarium circinatum]|uniref:Oxidoreductase n=1 Tax=Fusarium circinatum TaxID=48490 RepID=A0A8H5UAI2_FUSCI|nr:oxidoreductase [Fusarium circinatum]